MSLHNIRKVLKTSVGYCLFEDALLQLSIDSGMKRKEIVDKLKEQDFRLIETLRNNYTYDSKEFIITVSTNGILWFIKHKTN